MDMHIPLATGQIEGELLGADGARGVVLFAHGSGSSRFSPRSQAVAQHLQRRGLATALMDLLTPEESVDPATTFDIALLAQRVLLGAEWLAGQAGLARLPLGLFGASTGAAAALTAAAMQPMWVKAVVSRGGRPDLTLDLAGVQAPTLLIVGTEDPVVMAMNEQAFAALQCPKQLQRITGATHLFEEPGALDRVAKLAGDWFQHHLVRANDDLGGARPGHPRRSFAS